VLEERKAALSHNKLVRKRCQSRTGLLYRTVLETTVALLQLSVKVVQGTTDRIAVEVCLR